MPLPSEIVGGVYKSSRALVWVKKFRLQLFATDLTLSKHPHAMISNPLPRSFVVSRWF